MSKLEKLIEELCPDGVEYVQLGSYCNITTGKLNANAQVENGRYPFFTCNENPFRIDTYEFNTEAIIVSGNGSQVGHVNYYKGKFNAYQRTYVLSDFSNYNVNFLLHHIKGNLRYYIDKHSKKGSVPYITMPMIEKFPIPLPPLPVQEEIVRILDKFTLLEAELEAELEARKHQYEYYRDDLLDGKKRYLEVKLNEVASYTKGRIDAKKLNSRNYVGVDNILQEKKGKIDATYIPTSGKWAQFETNDILIGNIRPYLKKIWKATTSGGTNGDVLVIQIKKSAKIIITSKYLYHVLASDDFFYYDVQHSKGAKMPRGDKTAVMDYPIPLPPLAEQEHIVAILDRFDTLVNDISKGLPAEINARRKQYEYYRDKLLTFKEKKV